MLRADIEAMRKSNGLIGIVDRLRLEKFLAQSYRPRPF
jgi:hypothetical protein